MLFFCPGGGCLPVSVRKDADADPAGSCSGYDTRKLRPGVLSFCDGGGAGVPAVGEACLCEKDIVC